MFEIVASPLREEEGRFNGILQIVRDVTAAAQVEEVLSRARNEWLTTADSVPDLIFLTDLEGRIIRCNRAVKAFLAKEYHEILGLGLRDALQPALAGGSAIDLERGELVCERPRATLEVDSYPAHLEGRPYGTAWVMRDVTAVRRLESIASSVDMMNNLGHVLASVRHEIGNPINAIKTALSVLRENVESFTPEKRKTYVDRCMDDVGRVSALLENLRTFNMFETVRCEPVFLVAFLRRFATLVTEQLESQKVTFEVQMSVSDAATVSVDQRALQQVLLGLVSNASDAVAGRKRGRIVLEADVETEHVRIAVADNGVGIAPADLAMVFLPLFTTKPHGTGLGLAIARNLVTKMNGTVEVRSRPSRGTRVEIVLPRVAGIPSPGLGVDGTT